MEKMLPIITSLISVIAAIVAVTLSGAETKSLAAENRKMIEELKTSQIRERELRLPVPIPSSFLIHHAPHPRRS